MDITRYEKQLLFDWIGLFAWQVTQSISLRHNYLSIFLGSKLKRQKDKFEIKLKNLS